MWFYGKIKKRTYKLKAHDENLKNAPTDDGTFYGCLYDLYVFIGIVKGVSDINNGNGITLEELEKEREALYENYSRNFG